jgi:hypothetical protein
MGRLHTPKKPTVWNPDSFQVAVAAARKYSQPIPPPPIPLPRPLEISVPPPFVRYRTPSPGVKRPCKPEVLVDMVEDFDEAELRTVFANILRHNVEARRKFEEFVDAP